MDSGDWYLGFVPHTAMERAQAQRELTCRETME